MPKLVGENVLMRIFIGEGDKFGGRPLHEALVELLKKERFHGATVLRGVAGFGSVKGELRLLCNHLQAEVRTAADERFHAYHGEVTGRVTGNLREAMTGWKGHLGRVTREFEGGLVDAMGASIDILYRDATAFLEREVGTIAAWSAKPTRGTGSRRSGPRSRSSTASNPGYPEFLK